MKGLLVVYASGRVVWRGPGDFDVEPDELRREVEAVLAEPVEEFYSVPLRDESGEVVGMGCYATRTMRPGTFRHARAALSRLPDAFVSIKT